MYYDIVELAWRRLGGGGGGGGGGERLHDIPSQYSATRLNPGLQIHSNEPSVLLHICQFSELQL